MIPQPITEGKKGGPILDYTKGPWDEIGFGHDMQVVIVNHQKDISTPIKRADYSLIKAAPDMYEALREITNQLPELWLDQVRNGQAMLEINRDTVDRILDALAKAEGKEA